MRSKKILIATFSIYKNGKRTSINGMIEAMLSYFLPKIDELDLIDGFHPGSNDVISLIESYKNKKIISSKKSIISLFLYPILYFQNNNATQIIFKIRDFLSVFELIVRVKKKYDLFIGLESIYAMAGIILKNLRIVKTVVYYVSDYAPNRYENKLLNSFYLALDRFCCYHSDYIWDVSPAMLSARIKTGLDKKRCKPVILVPNALFPEQISYLSLQKINVYSLVFAGTFGSENGLTLLIKALKIVIKKYPNAKLHIFGGGYTEEPPQKITKKYNIEKNVIFHDFISDTIKLSNEIKKYSIGVAPYMAYKDSARWYADATKLRLYLGSGLPVITTHVPPLGKILEKKGAALIVKDNEKELATAIIRIFSSKSLYKKMRNNAITFAKNNTWENSYTKALNKMKFFN